MQVDRSMRRDLFFLSEAGVRSSLLAKKSVHRTMSVDADDISFDFRIYSCSYNHTANIWNVLLPILTFFILVLPNLIVMATTIPTLKYLYTASKTARRVQGSIPWQGALTVAATATVYCISYLSLSIFYIGEYFVQTRFLKINFFRTAHFLTAISVMSNFYIYALTIKSFRRYILSRILALNHFNIISNSAKGRPTTGTCLLID